MERPNYPNVGRNERKPVEKAFPVTRFSRVGKGHNLDPNEREPHKKARRERSHKGRRLEKM